MTIDKNKIAVDTYEIIARKYTQRYYNNLDQELPYIDNFLSHLPDGGRVLDIGCGPGNYAQYMHKRGYEVIGIDLSKEMLRIAREMNQGMSFIEMDMRSLDYPKNVFNGLLSLYSLIHIPTSEVAGVLKNCYRILVPGGFMLLIAQGGGADKIVEEPMQAGRKMFFNFFTVKRTTKMLERAGFTLIMQKRIPNKEPETSTLSNEIIVTLVKKPL